MHRSDTSYLLLAHQFARFADEFDKLGSQCVVIFAFGAFGNFLHIAQRPGPDVRAAA